MLVSLQDAETRAPTEGTLTTLAILWPLRLNERVIVAVVVVVVAAAATFAAARFRRVTSQARSVRGEARAGTNKGRPRELVAGPGDFLPALMHATVRGERLLGIKRPTGTCPSATARPPPSFVTVARLQTDNICASKPDENADDGQSSASFDAESRDENPLTTFNSAFAALIMLSLFMNIPM